MKKDNTFFDLLCLNDKSKIHDYIISHGKGPKPVCPIIFMKDEENEQSSFGSYLKAQAV